MKLQAKVRIVLTAREAKRLLAMAKRSLGKPPDAVDLEEREKDKKLIESYEGKVGGAVEINAVLAEHNAV